MEASVVARLHKVAELVCYDELQAGERVCGEARVHTDRRRARRAGAPACLHDSHVPARGAYAHLRLEALRYGWQRANDLVAIAFKKELLERCAVERACAATREVLTANLFGEKLTRRYELAPERNELWDTVGCVFARFAPCLPLHDLPFDPGSMAVEERLDAPVRRPHRRARYNRSIVANSQVEVFHALAGDEDGMLRVACAHGESTCGFRLCGTVCHGTPFVHLIQFYPYRLR